MNDSLPILNCDGCGVCCQNIGHPMFYPHQKDPHWERLPQSLRDELLTYIDSLEDVDIGQPCIWYDAETKQCRHYDFRPQMCRDFEVDSYHCRRMRQANGID